MRLSQDGPLVEVGRQGRCWSPFLVTPETLRRARESFAGNGFAVIGPPALSESFFLTLREEASRQRRLNSWQLRSGDGRSRVAEYNFRGHFGFRAGEFLSGGVPSALMLAVTEQPVAPSWTASCFTYYDRESSYLGRHCDKSEACFLTMIIGLESRWQGSNPPSGNQLWIYESVLAKLPKAKVTTLPNRIVILDGKSLPHERPAIGCGQLVNVLCACFKSANDERVSD
jgi:hypothetical protein